jgi:ribonuclease HII
MPGLKAFHSKNLVEAGCDEAGRGCLAGPVVAAAVILPISFNHPWLNDSKKLTEKKRDELRPLIEQQAMAWGVGVVNPEEIDEINILNASFLAMHRAIDQLSLTPEKLLIDGNRFNAYAGIPHLCIIKGDGIYRSIAAASILAKTYRDEIMLGLNELYPQYGWSRNKGYPTSIHRQAIRKFGSCEHHRKSFTLIPGQLKLDLR